MIERADDVLDPRQLERLGDVMTDWLEHVASLDDPDDAERVLADTLYGLAHVEIK